MDSIFAELSPATSSADLQALLITSNTSHNEGVGSPLGYSGGGIEPREAPSLVDTSAKAPKQHPNEFSFSSQSPITTTQLSMQKPANSKFGDNAHRLSYAPLTRRRSSRVVLAVSEGAICHSRKKGPRRGENFELRQAIWKADFWLLVVSFFCGTGTALTAINNLAQMGYAQGYNNVRLFVSLLSVWSFVGRLGGGYTSEEIAR